MRKQDTSNPTVIRKGGVIPQAPQLEPSKIKDDCCDNCCYMRDGYCKESPQRTVKGPDDWCGRHKRRGE